MISDQADEIIGKLFSSLKNRYQNNLEPMRCIEFIFDCVYLRYYKYYE